MSISTPTRVDKMPSKRYSNASLDLRQQDHQRREAMRDVAAIWGAVSITTAGPGAGV